MKKHILTSMILLLVIPIQMNCQSNKQPLKLAIIGLTHTHVHWILGRENTGDVEIVGIVEPNRELAERYSKQHGFSMDLVYESMEELVNNSEPEAVAAFGTIYEHLEVVEFFAPKGIHVMVEKPLAVSLEHARAMEELAKKHDIHLLTNYETTWYPSNHKAREMLEEGRIGEMRKVIVRDGHKGPRKLGIDEEFLDWLLDPEQNGAGALMDFGCYGANLMTWLQNGKRPLSVTAVTQQLQKDNNPMVDDEAIIILTYENSNCVIQASWNWPIGRKDMEIYGLEAAIYADNRNDLRLRIAEGYDGFEQEEFNLEERPYPYNDPFSYFAALVHKEIEVLPFSLSSLENNMIVMEILQAAMQSARSGKTIPLK
ncbi:Gfo/Idh/MocA family oxidoreductase [Gramella sp. GC03-9]|uniref:Gfo/Idh/MocA family oxidoreductase n=1 Tax=Christiangramia oceanisediminis TaxID=2920386 RepID=A0A9X2I7A4_9FLAO|nr:Gfo/Idh/MocA family oxidoreductase [Gramella oceanisediminis]MCP9198816.1 Gfo/Idh/MocA family oxidoreductase [Gramella oceanisediminis]